MKNIAVIVNENCQRTIDNNKRPRAMSKEGAHVVTQKERGGEQEGSWSVTEKICYMSPWHPQVLFFKAKHNTQNFLR